MDLNAMRQRANAILADRNIALVGKRCAKDVLALCDEAERIARCYGAATGKRMCGSSPLLYIECKQMTEMRTQLTNRTECLEAIRDYEPDEILYDQFAYERLRDAYGDAARNGLGLSAQGANE